MKVAGFLVPLSAVVPYVIGFFVGLGFGLAGDGDGRGFVMKFGSVVTCHGVDDHESERTKKQRFVIIPNGKNIFKTH